MPGKRELTTGMLAKEASFRLIVSGNIGSGNIGVKEIERLIQLEIDKEILADHGEQPEPDFLNERRRQLSRPQNQNSAAIIIATESTLTAI